MNIEYSTKFTLQGTCQVGCRREKGRRAEHSPAERSCGGCGALSPEEHLAPPEAAWRHEAA